MNRDKRDYASGTYVVNQLPWGLFVSAKALCSDGKVRTVSRIAQTADTFFSIPASIRVKGKTVAGYITFGTASGLSTATESDPARVEFHAYGYRKNGGMLPEWNQSIHTACVHCGQDIEGTRRGNADTFQWRDRGNNATCANGKPHAPIPQD